MENWSLPCVEGFGGSLDPGPRTIADRSNVPGETSSPGPRGPFRCSSMCDVPSEHAAASTAARRLAELIVRKGLAESWASVAIVAQTVRLLRRPPGRLWTSGAAGCELQAASGFRLSAAVVAARDDGGPEADFSSL
eukprot:5842563-Pyramimonas_sp.AAC.3